MADATVSSVVATAVAAVSMPAINAVWNPIVLAARYAPSIELAGVYAPNIVLEA